MDTYVTMYVKRYIKGKMVEEALGRVFFLFVCNCAYCIYFQGKRNTI